MSTIDDLLSRRRRGALSEADERRVQMAVQTSRDHQLSLLAGDAFERAGAPQSGDAALVKSIVRQVEGEWSGTFQRVVARRRLSRWVSVPVLVVGVAAASLGGYRALRAPVENPRPVAGLAPQLAAPPELAAVPPAAPELAELRPARSAASFGVVLPAPSELLTVPSVEAVLPLAAPLALEEPAASANALAPTPLLRAAVPPGAVLPAASPVPPALAAAPAVAARSWRLPRPKPHAGRDVTEIEREPDLGAAAPALAAPVAARAGGAELDPLPDLESSRALFRRANQLRRTDWDAAASLYERLALRHSESREAGVAEMALGKHALTEGRPRQALQWFEAYQRRADGELAAEAVWGAARALESLGENERARELWRHLIEQYPASAYAAAAREQLGP
jgi:tetratricopeptide (TPR) repeat protein